MLRDQETTKEAHQEFMKRYHSIFQRPILKQEILQKDDKYEFIILSFIPNIKDNLIYYV